MKFLVVIRTPPLRGLLGTVPAKVTTEIVSASSALQAANTVDAPHVGTMFNVVDLQHVKGFERTTQIDEKEIQA